MPDANYINVQCLRKLQILRRPFDYRDSYWPIEKYELYINKHIIHETKLYTNRNGYNHQSYETMPLK